VESSPCQDGDQLGDALHESAARAADDAPSSINMLLSLEQHSEMASKIKVETEVIK
jgi:hypothetical protein